MELLLLLFYIVVVVIVVVVVVVGTMRANERAGQVTHVHRAYVQFNLVFIIFWFVV